MIALLTATGAVQSGELEPVSRASAPELSGQTANDADWRLADQRGHVVLINFWAGWCPSCLEEMPALNRLAARLKDRLVVVGVNVGEQVLRVRNLVGQYAIGFPVLLDPDQTAFIRWHATVLPTTFVLDAQGRVRLIGRGPLDWDDADVTAPIEKLLTETAAPSPDPGPH